jgi:putative transposase
MRIREIAAVRVRYGYQRIHILLRREGWMINRKRVYRLYKLEGLNLRSKRPRRHVSARIGNGSLVPPQLTINGRWTSSPMPCSMANASAL